MRDAIQRDIGVPTRARLFKVTFDVTYDVRNRVDAGRAFLARVVENIDSAEQRDLETRTKGFLFPGLTRVSRVYRERRYCIFRHNKALQYSAGRPRFCPVRVPCALCEVSRPSASKY
jgi:hypothetical protein